MRKHIYCTLTARTFLASVVGNIDPRKREHQKEYKNLDLKLNSPTIKSIPPEDIACDLVSLFWPSWLVEGLNDSNSYWLQYKLNGILADVVYGLWLWFVILKLEYRLNKFCVCLWSSDYRTMNYVLRLPSAVFLARLWPP